MIIEIRGDRQIKGTIQYQVRIIDNNGAGVYEIRGFPFLLQNVVEKYLDKNPLERATIKCYGLPGTQEEHLENAGNAHNTLVKVRKIYMPTRF